MSPRQRTSLFFDEDLKTGLRELKDRDGIPESEAVRRAVREYLQKRGITIDEKKPAHRRAPTRRKA